MRINLEVVLRGGRGQNCLWLVLNESLVDRALSEGKGFALRDAGRLLLELILIFKLLNRGLLCRVGGKKIVLHRVVG